jgi:rhodanese-related sulfurtransferase
MFKSAHEFVLAAKQNIREISLDQAQTALAEGTPLLLDVREPAEYEQGHLTAALNLPRGMLEFMLSGNPALQDTARPLIVYCKTGGRAALAAQTLQAMGFAEVSSIAGGFDAWAAAGLPVAKPQEVSFE